MKQVHADIHNTLSEAVPLGKSIWLQYFDDKFDETKNQKLLMLSFSNNLPAPYAYTFIFVFCFDEDFALSFQRAIFIHCFT